MKYLPHGSRMVFHISTFFDSRGLLTNPYRPCHASGRKSYGILPLNSRLSHLGSRFLASRYSGQALVLVPSVSIDVSPVQLSGST